MTTLSTDSTARYNLALCQLQHAALMNDQPREKRTVEILEACLIQIKEAEL